MLLNTHKSDFMTITVVACKIKICLLRKEPDYHQFSICAAGVCIQKQTHMTRFILPSHEKIKYSNDCFQIKCLRKFMLDFLTLRYSKSVTDTLLLR
jgi:hypothetical protein